MIKKDSIHQVLSHADIVEVAVKLIPDLKKKGTTWTAKSPFTSEKTPSFFVVPQKQIFKCFSSGKGGSAVDLVMEKERLTFPEAIKWLADFQNITLEYGDKELAEEKKSKEQDADLVLRATLNKYRKALPENSVAMDYIRGRGITDDDLVTWSIGAAPNEWKFITGPIIEKGLWGIAEELGVCKSSKGKNFDVFRGRLIFPVHDQFGKLVGFGGRSLPGQEDTAKYLNSPESFYYRKSSLLYGLHMARTAIAKREFVYLVEGYLDVITMHRHGMENTVAPCGTAITKSQAKSLRRFCSHVVLLMDGDAAGLKAMRRALDTFLQLEFKVELAILPDGKDPDDLLGELGLPENLDTLSDYPNNTSYQSINGLTTDAVLYFADQALSTAQDPDKKQEAVDQVISMLQSIPQPVKKDAYLDQICKKHKLKKADITRMVSKEDKKKKKVKHDHEEPTFNLPPGADRDEFEEWGFYEADDGYWFMSSSMSDTPKFKKRTNFTVEPLFHVYSRVDNKRLMRVNNGRKEVLLEVPSSALVSFNDFRKTIINEGNFQFLPGATQMHFQMLMNKFGHDFPICYELVTLGYQEEGFYAFADGVFKDGAFEKVDEMGVVQYTQKLVNGKGEKREEERRFYSPAFSSIFRDSRADDDEYENDRHFVFKQSPVSLDRWMELMVEVYGEKGQVAIAYVIAALFRDIFFRRFGFFPHIFCYGEKGSGKSKFCESVHNLFFSGLSAFNLNSGTEVGYYSRLARVRNAINWFDEYHDYIDESRFQGLKSAYDGVGRERGKKTGKNKTEISRVNSANLISGQYLSTRDDNSLTTRSILLHFIKAKRSSDQIDAFDELKAIEEIGLSSLVVDLLKHRDKMSEMLMKYYLSLKHRMKKDLEGQEYDDRAVGNYCCMLAPVGLLMQEKLLDFPFSWKQLWKYALSAVVMTTELVSEGEGVSEFWNIVQDLIDAREISVEHDFIWKTPDAITIRKSNRSERWSNEKQEELLFLNLNKVHGAYMREHRSRTGRSGIDKITLQSYFKSKTYFVGNSPVVQFEKRKTSAFVFRETLLEDKGFSLKRSLAKQPASAPVPAKDKQREFQY